MAILVQSNKKPSVTFPSQTGSIVTFDSQYAGLPLKSHTVDIDSVSGVSAINIGSDAKYAGFINFNQLVKNGNFASTSGWYRNSSVISVSNNIMSITATMKGLQLNSSTIPINKQHRYIFRAELKSNSTNVTFGFQNNGVHSKVASNGNDTWKECIGFLSNSRMGNDVYTVAVVFDNRTSDWTEIQLKNVMLIDLTAMFGTTKADEIYNMEQQTAGSGVAYFRSLFPNDYYDYNAGTLTTVSAVNGSTNSFFTIPIGQTVNEATYNARTGVLEVTQPSVQTIQLPPCPIDTLQGENNIWADTGETTVQHIKIGG